MRLAKLILSEPFKPAKHILIQKNPFRIGRNDDCDFVLDRAGISKYHAQLVSDGEQYILQDLESKNGTLLNAQFIKQAALKDHDLISMGGVDFTFRSIEEQQFNTDLEKNLNKMRSAIEYTKSINNNLILDPMLDEIISALMRLSQAERGFLLMENDEGNLQMMRSVNISSEDLHTEKFKLSMTAVDKAIQSKQAVAISNASDDSYFGDQTSVQELELKTLVCIPIVADQDHVIGVLYADSDSKEQEFAELDVELLSSLAANAAIAIQNAKLNRDIWNLIVQVADVLKAVEQKTVLDGPLQSSVRDSLNSLSTLKRKRFPKEKGILVFGDTV